MDMVREDVMVFMMALTGAWAQLKSVSDLWPGGVPSVLLGIERGRGDVFMKSNDYRLGYRGDIEGLRAVAILLVIAAHAGVPWLAGGFIGVDVFFVLSGFLITGLLLRELTSTGGIDFMGFYIRRIRRLMPALILMIVVASAGGIFLLGPGEQESQAASAAMAALWLSNLSLARMQIDYFAQGTETNLFLHTWSLGVEEQFYLVWPVLLYWSLAQGRPESLVPRLKAVMLGIFALSLCVCVDMAHRSPQWAFYMMPVRAWEFAAGALLWLYFGQTSSCLARRGEAAGVGAMIGLGWFGIAIVIGTGACYNSQMPYPGWRAVLPVLGTMAIIASGWGSGKGGVSRILSLPWLQNIGRISYSWYLWHWPIFVLGAAVSGSHAPWIRAAEVLVSLGVSIVSYRFVESPIRHQEIWLARRRLTLLSATGTTLAVCLLSLSWSDVAAEHNGNPAMQRYSRARFDAPSIYAMGCDDSFHSDRVRLCRFGSHNSKHTLVLMGDSIAAQWFPALSPVAFRPDWQLIVITKSACPMVDEPIFYARIRRQYTECETWRQRAMEQVESMRPDAVVLSTGIVTGQSFSQAQWIDGTARVLTMLSSQVKKIYLLRSTPHLNFDGPDCLALHAKASKSLDVTLSCENLSDDAHEQQVYLWLQEAARRFPNVRVINMNDLVCPGMRCSAAQGGEVVFRDDQHLTATFAASLGEAMSLRMGY